MARHHGRRRVFEAAASKWSALALALVMTMLPVAASAASAEPAGRQLYVEPSPLARIIDALPGMPPEARLDLAVLIVETLAAAYEAELEQAMLELGRRGANQRELTRWFQAIAPILDDLRDWQAVLSIAAAVDLRLERHNQVLIRIDGRPLWVAWPRPSAQARLERELATEFCLRHECPGGNGEDPAARTLAPSAVQGAWSLSQYRPPTWQSEHGVNCEFPEFSRIGEKERTCRDLVVDLHALAAALRTAMRQGEGIEWPHLALHAATAGAQHSITVNAREDYIAVYVPALAASQVDWGEARRWLQARVDGRSTTATVLRAAPGR